MNVCLISAATATNFDSRFLSKSDALRAVVEHPPVGVLVLASVLEEMGVGVSVVDLNRTYLEYLKRRAACAGRPDFAAFAAEMLKGVSADVFGFGTLCSSYSLTLRIAACLRSLRKDAAIILGGPHASAVDTATLEAFPFLDAIIRGEGEEILPQYLNLLAEGRLPLKLAGVTYRNDGRVFRNPDAPVIADLDRVPAPAYHHWPYLERWREIILELGRGCPFGCTFCSTNDFFRRRYRMRSPEAMLQQMKSMRERYGFRHFGLIHDSFAADRKRVVEFCAALIGSGAGFRWSSSARTDCLDDDLVRLLRRSGCHALFFGVETGSPELQRAIAKNLDLTEARRIIRRVNQSGIACVVSCIIGFPQETAASLEQTVSFLNDALQHKKVSTQIHVLSPLPGTPIARECGHLLRLDDDFSDISSPGGTLQPADLAMVRSHPGIFSHYYHVPTASLDRRVIVELREFITSLTDQLRWLHVALHQDGGSVLPIFRLWKDWRGRRGLHDFRGGAPLFEYYASSFHRDFLQFLESDYIPRGGRNADLLEALVQCERMRAKLTRRRSRKKGPFCRKLKYGDVVVRAPGVVVFEIGVDLRKLLTCLRRRGRLDRVPRTPTTIALRDTADGIDRLQLKPDSARLLSLCDGTRTVRQIRRAFAAGQKLFAGVPAAKAAAYGLSSLLHQRLIQGGLTTARP